MMSLHSSSIGTCQTKQLPRYVSRCRDFGAMGFGSAPLSEEQERELAPEIEEERQVERTTKDGR